MVVGVRKTFEAENAPVRALRGANLRVPAGDFVALMGPSGCGKSTLLNLVAGLDVADEGTISVGGQLVTGRTEDELSLIRRQHIGIVFQFFNLLESMTALENVALPAIIAGTKRKPAESRARDLLDLLGVGDKAKVVPGSLSGGQRQRLAIARALANEPTLLLADEPTGALDSDSGHEIVELLSRLHHGGQTIVLVTHDNDVAQAAEHLIYDARRAHGGGTGPEAGRGRVRGSVTTTPEASASGAAASRRQPGRPVRRAPHRWPPSDAVTAATREATAPVAHDVPDHRGGEVTGMGAHPSRARAVPAPADRDDVARLSPSALLVVPALAVAGYGLAKAVGAGVSRGGRDPGRAHAGLGGGPLCASWSGRRSDRWVDWCRWPPCWARWCSPPPSWARPPTGGTGHAARILATLVPALLMAVGCPVPPVRTRRSAGLAGPSGGRGRRATPPGRPSACGRGSARAG